MARGTMGRAYTEAVENLAAIADTLIAAEADNREDVYNWITESVFDPMVARIRRTFGKELGDAAIRDAYALARALRTMRPAV